MEDFAKNNKETLTCKLKLKALPTRSLFNRVCLNLDIESLKFNLELWIAEVFQTLGLHSQVVSIDGKSLAGTVDKSKCHSKDHGFAHVVSMFDQHLNVTVSCIESEDKVSEVFTFRKLLTQAQIVPKIVTADALHCNQDTFRFLKKNNLDYIIGVKANCSLLLSELKKLTRNDIPNNDSIKKTYEYQDSSIKRTVTAYQIPPDFKVVKKYKPRAYSVWNQKTRQYTKQLRVPVYKSWGHLNFSSFIKIERTNYRKHTKQVNYYLSSLPPNAEKLGKLIQKHWFVENNLHREKDVVFKEDKHLTKYYRSAKVFSRIITTVINIYRLNNYQSMKKATQRFCNRVAECLTLLGYDLR